MGFWNGWVPCGMAGSLTILTVGATCEQLPTYPYFTYLALPLDRNVSRNQLLVSIKAELLQSPSS